MNNNGSTTSTGSSTQQSSSSSFEGFPFPHSSANAQQSLKLDAAQITPFFFSPGATGYPLESPTNMQQWYFNSSAASPAFNFDTSLPTSPYYQQPLPSHQQPQQSSHQPDLDPSSSFAQQQLQLQQQQTRAFYQLQQQLSYQQIPLQQPSFNLQQPSSNNPQYGQPQQQYRNYPSSNPPLNLTQNNLASTSTSRSYNPPPSSIPPALTNDDASLTYSSDSSAASSTFGAGIRQVAATGHPLCVDLRSLEEDGRKAGGRGSAVVEAKVEDEDDGSFEIPGFKSGGEEVGTRSSSRRRSRNAPVKYQEDEEEDENSQEDEEDPRSDDDNDASDSPSSSSSTTSSYHEGRRPSNTSTTSKPKSKPTTKHSATSTLPKSTSSSSTKRRVSEPSSTAARRQLSSSPPLPLKRVKLSPSSSSPSDFLSLPPLPEDFDSYGEGGASRFSGEDHHSGGPAIPDFSGREDCWGIGKEAYQQLSAKAKKQLRNKLGARRFRERRKEYITTLEERIAGRDGLITETRSRLVRSIDLVKELQAKIDALEQASSS